MRCKAIAWHRQKSQISPRSNTGVFHLHLSITQSMQVNYQNPLQQEHLVLLKIRKEIIKQFPKSRIEVVSQSVKADYTTVSTKIITQDSEGSVCHGQVLTLASPMVNLLKAEIVALTMSAGELGIDIQFEGDAEKTVVPDVAPVQERVRFDRETILNCRDLKTLYDKLKSLGMSEEVKNLQEYRKHLLNQPKTPHPITGVLRRKSLTVEVAADFLYPVGAPASFVKVDTPKANIKKDSVKKKQEMEVIVKDPPKVPVRSMNEAQKLRAGLIENGFTDQIMKEKGFGNLTNFSLFGTDEEYDKLISDK